MRFKTSLPATALVVGLAVPAPALAWGGVPGCVNLPEYERALGALQGMSSACDMSVEEASRIVAAHGNVPGGLFGRLFNRPAQPAAEALPVSPARQGPATRVHRQRPRHGAAHRREAVER